MPDWLFPVLGMVAAGAGAYAAVRADLARAHERASQALESAGRAHARIDSLTALKG
jgi:hypothetical protein